MSEQEAACSKNDLYACLNNAEVDHIDYDGGNQYGTRIVIYFTNGKTLRIYAKIDSSKYGIRPRIERVVGSWGKIG